MWRAGVAAALALASGCAMKVNGKSYDIAGSGKPPSSGSSGSNGSNGSSSSSGGTPGQTAPTHRSEANLPPPPDFSPEPIATAPADPWAAVAGDQPRHLTEAQEHDWRVSGEAFACTAAHDHCLSSHVWFVVQDSQTQAAVYGFDHEGLTTSPANAHHSGGLGRDAKYTAYRTVPVTRKNLVTGSHVFALRFPAKHPASGQDVYDNMWVGGEVERIDWEMGFVYLRGLKDPFWISAARKAVLSWRQGDKVTILGNAERESLAVPVGQVVLP